MSSFGIISAYLRSLPRGVNEIRHADLVEDLRALGYAGCKTGRGVWTGAPEKVVLVTSPSLYHLVDLGSRYGQEAIVYNGRLIRLRGQPVTHTPYSLTQRISFDRTASAVAGRYLMAGHYRSASSIHEVVERWSKDGDKLLDESMPLMVPTRDVWPYREYTWSRKKSRNGYAFVDGKKVLLPGHLKWDAILSDMASRGWQSRYPLIMEVGRNGIAKVGEGNHRLAIAVHIGIPAIPVSFIFREEVKKDRSQTRAGDVPPVLKRESVRESVEVARGGTEDENVDEILKLLGI